MPKIRNSRCEARPYKIHTNFCFFNHFTIEMDLSILVIWGLGHFGMKIYVIYNKMPFREWNSLLKPEVTVKQNTATVRPMCKTGCDCGAPGYFVECSAVC